MSASPSELTHLKRELMHALWELFLDEKFMHAYEHGIHILCGDGIWQRIFPRLLTYSADYPEK
jgi:Plavaka transposase